MSSLPPSVQTASTDPGGLLLGSVADFRGQFRMATVSYCVSLPQGESDDPGFIGKVRGALGRALFEVASPGNRAKTECSFDPPCAYQILWRNNGEVRPGFPIPSPLILRTDRVGDDLSISASLFGFAADYLGEVTDALLRGLRRGLTGRRRLRPEPHKRDFVEVNGIDFRPITRQVRVEMLTPVLFRQAATAHIDPAAFLRSLVDRACGLAAWHGFALDKETTVALRSAMGRIEGQWLAVDARKWRRGAVQQMRIVPMQGALGTLALRGDLTGIAPYLALGEHFHVGSRTAWGQGRYKITEYL